MENKPNKIIWHHTASALASDQAAIVNAHHKSLGFPISKLGFYGGYHILIEHDGSIIRFREDTEIGCHASGENIDSLGIALAGNFNVEYPTAEQKHAFIHQLLAWMNAWDIDKSAIEPHRTDDATDCPGKLLADDYPQSLLAHAALTSTNEILLDIIKYIQSKLTD